MRGFVPVVMPALAQLIRIAMFTSSSNRWALHASLIDLHVQSWMDGVAVGSRTYIHMLARLLLHGLLLCFFCPPVRLPGRTGAGAAR